MLIIDNTTPDQILALQQEYENSATNGEFSDFFYFELVDKLDSYVHHREDVNKFMLDRHLDKVAPKYWSQLILSADADDINLSQFNEVVYLIAAYYAAKSKDEDILIKLLEICGNTDLDSDTFSLVVDIFINDNYDSSSAEIIMDFVRDNIKQDNFKHVYYSVVALNNILNKEQLLELDEMVILTNSKGKSVAVSSGLLNDIVYYLIVTKQFHLLSVASREVVVDNLENASFTLVRENVTNFDDIVEYADKLGVTIVEYNSDVELEKVYKELGLDVEDDYNEDDLFDEDDALIEDHQYRHDTDNETNMSGGDNKEKINHDDPCSCGSGKKYKKYCI